MILGTLELQLRLDGCFNLKDKRRVLRSLMDKARREFGVSISETADQDLWNVATLAVAAVSNEAGHVESVLQHVIDMVERNPAIEIEAADKTIERR